MKNNILNLNTVIAYTDIKLIKQNIVCVKITNVDGIITVKLNSSQLKLFKRYWWNNSTLNINNHNNNPKYSKFVDRNLVLDDIKNFRKYFNEFSFAHDLDQLKRIFINNNNLSIELLYRYVDASDYLWLKDLDESILHNGILINKNRYYNILIDLKTESIPKELIYDYPISLLFKFLITKSGYLIELTEPGSLDKFFPMLLKLEEQGYISREYYDVDEILDLNGLFTGEDYYEYNGYCGNYETYFAFKELLKVYLKGINIYSYNGKYYSYDQLKSNYDIYSFDHSKFVNDNLLEYTNDIDDALIDVIKYHPDVNTFTCQCIEVQDPVSEDPENFLMEPLAKLKLIFKVKSIEGKNKVINIKPLDTITMYLSDFL